MTRLTNAVYPVIAVAALVVVGWQPTGSVPAAGPAAAVRAVAADAGTGLRASSTPAVSPSASSRV